MITGNLKITRNEKSISFSEKEKGTIYMVYIQENHTRHLGKSVFINLSKSSGSNLEYIPELIKELKLTLENSKEIPYILFEISSFKDLKNDPLNKDIVSFLSSEGFKNRNMSLFDENTFNSNDLFVLEKNSNLLENFFFISELIQKIKKENKTFVLKYKKFSDLTREYIFECVFEGERIILRATEQELFLNDNPVDVSRLYKIFKAKKLKAIFNPSTYHLKSTLKRIFPSVFCEEILSFIKNNCPDITRLEKYCSDKTNFNEIKKSKNDFRVNFGEEFEVISIDIDNFYLVLKKAKNFSSVEFFEKFYFDKKEDAINKMKELAHEHIDKF